MTTEIDTIPSRALPPRAGFDPARPLAASNINRLLAVARLYRDMQRDGVEPDRIRDALRSLRDADPACAPDAAARTASDLLLRLIARRPDLFWRDPPRGAAPDVTTATPACC